VRPNKTKLSSNVGGVIRQMHARAVEGCLGGEGVGEREGNHDGCQSDPEYTKIVPSPTLAGLRPRPHRRLPCRA
jgi:hypothetical protein